MIELGTELYRAANVGDEVGRFFGLVKPATAVWAEALYNIEKWGNRAEEVVSFRTVQEFTAYVGDVAGGIGRQVLLPGGLDPLTVV